jgi:hypothetical protein
MRARVPRDWRGTLADAVERFGEVTGGSRILPSFLIVGGQRCGTNSLYAYLLEHPAVMRALPHQEVHYFDLHHDRGLRWYRGHFPTMAWARVTGARTGHPALTGESSPYYMFHPLAPERIAATLPGARLLVLLRDPVDRAYSQFHHERSRGNESLGFEDALEHEAARLEGEEDRIRREPGYVSFSHQHHSYLSRGRYADQLETVFAAIPRDHVAVVVSERLFAEPETVESEVLDFLGLPPASDRPHGRHNAGRYDEMPPALRRRLADHFAEPNHRLAAMLGCDLPWS